MPFRVHDSLSEHSHPIHLSHHHRALFPASWHTSEATHQEGMHEVRHRGLFPATTWDRIEGMCACWDPSDIVLA